jgi:hypothetical protein
MSRERTKPGAAVRPVLLLRCRLGDRMNYSDDFDTVEQLCDAVMLVTTASVLTFSEVDLTESNTMTNNAHIRRKTYMVS